MNKKNSFVLLLLYLVCFTCISLLSPSTKANDTSSLSILSTPQTTAASVRQQAAEIVHHLNDYTLRIGRISSLMLRLAVSVDELTDRRKQIIETCRGYWTQQNQLELCLVKQHQSLHILRTAFNNAITIRDQLMAAIQHAGPESMGQESFDYLQTYMTQKNQIFLQFEANILQTIQSRYNAATARYAELSRQPFFPFDHATANVNSATQRSTRAQQQLLALRNELSISVERMALAIGEYLRDDRTLKAVSVLSGLEWLSAQIAPMTSAYQSIIDGDAAEQTHWQRLRSTYAQKVSQLQSTIGALTAADRATRVTRLEIRIRNEVLDSHILESDRRKMIQILDQARASLALHRAESNLEQVRLSEVLVERVRSWLTGSF